jgi:hypothetical protein
MRTRSAPSLTYDNWWIVGLSAPLAVLNVLALTVTLRGTGASFTFALIALLLLIGELVVSWGFTAPVNRATDNWTMLPGNLEQLRAQWEYSHAARAFLYVLAMGTLVMSVLDWRNQ